MGKPNRKVKLQSTIATVSDSKNSLNEIRLLSDEDITCRLDLIQSFNSYQAINNTFHLNFVVGCLFKFFQESYLLFLKENLSLLIFENYRKAFLISSYFLSLMGVMLISSYIMYQFISSKVESAFNQNTNLTQIFQRAKNTRVVDSVLGGINLLIGLFLVSQLGGNFQIIYSSIGLFWGAYYYFLSPEIEKTETKLITESVASGLTKASKNLTDFLNQSFTSKGKKRSYSLEVLYNATDNKVIIRGEASNPAKKDMPIDLVMGVLSDYLRSKMSQCYILSKQKNIHILVRNNSTFKEFELTDIYNILHLTESKRDLLKQIAHQLKVVNPKICYSQGQLTLITQNSRPNLFEKLKQHVDMEEVDGYQKISLPDNFNKAAILEILQAEKILLPEQKPRNNKLAKIDEKNAEQNLEIREESSEDIQYIVQPNYGNLAPIKLHSNKRWLPNLFSWVTPTAKKEVAEPVVLTFRDEKDEYHYDSRVKPINQDITVVRAIEQTKAHANQPDYFIVVNESCGNIQDPLTRLFNEEKINLVTRNHGVNGLVVKPQLEINGKEVLAKLKHDCDDRLIATKSIRIKRAGKPDAILFLMDNVVDHKQLKALSKNATRDEVVNDAQFTPALAKYT